MTESTLVVFCKKYIPYRGQRILYKYVYAPIAAVSQKFSRSASQNIPSLSEESRKSALTVAVEYVFLAEVKGDIAEFGTASGTTASFIAQALASYQLKPFETFGKKIFYLFDSFQGLPAITDSSDKDMQHVKSGVWSEGACKDLSKEQLQKLVCKSLPSDQVSIHEGWFKDTLPNIPPKTQFSMLHLDCDLYQSTLDVLDYCLSNRLISQGAIVCFDDWNCNFASNYHGQRKVWREMIEKFEIEYSDCGMYGWACWRFIIHSYKKR